MPPREALSWEKELLGLYISGHPLDRYEAQTAKAGSTIARLLAAPAEQAPTNWKAKRTARKTHLLVAHIDSIKPIITKSNSRMAFVALRDKTGTAEGVIFPETYKKIGQLLKEGSVAAMQCTVADRQDRKSILIENLKVLE